MYNEQIIYSSKISFFPFILAVIGAVFLGAIGLHLLSNIKDDTPIWIIILFPGLFLSFAILSIFIIFTLKKVEVTPFEILIRYIITRKQYVYNWNSITRVKMNSTPFVGKHMTVVHKGKSLKIHFNNKSFLFESIAYRDFDALIFQIERKLPKKLKGRMQSSLKTSEKKFKKRKERYWRIESKYVYPISVILFIALLIYNYFFK